MLPNYDLRREGEIVKKQLSEGLDPIVEARNLMSSAILCHVLLGLSDAGFYEYVSGKTAFSIEQARRQLDIDDFTFRALLDYLIGRGALREHRSDTDRLHLTVEGTRLFNVYTRGVMNVYLGGYRKLLGALGDVLSGSRALSDPALSRSTAHAAAGTAYSTCVSTIPAVFEVMKGFEARTCLDLGCGTGDFLIRFVQENPAGHGIGVDMSPEALESARASAKAFGVSDRLQFFQAEIGVNPLPLSPDEAARVDIVTSMYMLHEFGRGGRDAIVRVIRAIADTIPRCTLLALEVEGCEPTSFSEKPPAHYGRLDYRLIHALSGQGLPRPREDWHELFRDAGLDVLEPGVPSGGSLIYVARRHAS